MGLIERFLGSYSDNFLLALVLWPFASAACTLPILAYLYHRDGRLRFVSVVSTYLTVLYVLGLGCFTLYPLPSGDEGLGITYGVPWQLNPLAPLGDFMREGISVIPQIAFNVVFFVPLGFIAARLFRWGFWKTLTAGLITSFVIEAAQGTGLFGIYPYAYRTADVNDLMYNTAGAALGWWAAALLARVLPPGALADEDEVTHEPGFIRRCVAFWIDTTLVGIIASTVAGALTLLSNNVPGFAWLSALFIEQRLALWISAAAFVLVEGVLPWFHEGSTPGGGFVRMSCETREPAGVRRVAFYAARLAVLAGAFVYFPFAWPLLGLFYLVARRMPYDLL